MTETLRYLLPEILLIAAATVLYVAGSFHPARHTWFGTAMAALVAALVLVQFVAGASDLGVLSDPLSYYGRTAFLLAGILFLGLCRHLAPAARSGEYFGSLLLVVAGTLLTCSAGDLILVFLGLELISIPTYLLLYLSRHDATGQEAAAKYFLLSILSSALLLYGFSFLYGLSGSTRLDALTDLLQQWASTAAPAPLPTALLGIVLVFAGLGFKLAAVPFHFYAPDVYEGSTPWMAALLAVAPKAAATVALLRVASFTLVGLEGAAAYVATILAIITMTGGNVLGLLQSNVRRLLAYSSIAHAGYLLLGLAAGFWDRALAVHGVEQPFSGNQAVLFYLVAYVPATIGAFAVLVYLGRKERSVEHLDDLAGLVYTHPAAALAMACCLFSLTGIPPFAGFWGKLAVVFSTVSAAHFDSRLLIAALIAVVNAAIAAVYYLRLVVVMFLRQPVAAPQPVGGRVSLGVLLACGILTLAIGLFPNGVFRRARGTVDAASPIPAATISVRHDTIPMAAHRPGASVPAPQRAAQEWK